MSKLYFYIMFILLVPCFAGVKPGTELGNESGLTQPVNDKIDTKKSTADKKKNKRGWRNTLIAGGAAGLGIVGLTALMLSNRDVAAEAQPKVATPITADSEFWNYCMYSNLANPEDNQAALFNFVARSTLEHFAQLKLRKQIVFAGYCSGSAYHEGQIVARLGAAVGKVVLVDMSYQDNVDNVKDLRFSSFINYRLHIVGEGVGFKSDVFFMHNPNITIIHDDTNTRPTRQKPLQLTNQIDEFYANPHAIIFYTFTNVRDEFAVKYSLQDWLFFKSCVDDAKPQVKFFDENFLANALKARAQGRPCNLNFDAVLGKLEAFDGRANTNIRRFINFITQ